MSIPPALWSARCGWKFAQQSFSLHATISPAARTCASCMPASTAEGRLAYCDAPPSATKETRSGGRVNKQLLLVTKK
eukprot:2502988-Amphidinium_carterae.1